MVQSERAFEPPRGTKPVEDKRDRQISQLREKLMTKNGGVAELMEEDSKSKKENGEP